MFGVPVPHLLIGPRPLERVCVETVVLRRRRQHVVDERLAYPPRPAPQIARRERPVQQLGLIQPGCMRPASGGAATIPRTRSDTRRCRRRCVPGRRRGPGTPRAAAGAAGGRPAVRERSGRRPSARPRRPPFARCGPPGSSTGSPSRAARTRTPAARSGRGPRGESAPVPALAGWASRRCRRSRCHAQPAGTHSRSTTARARPALLELFVEPGRPPVTGAMWLEVDGIQDAPHGPTVDRVHDAVRHRLPGQVLTGPVWVTCNPRATGSRQASCTILARCRGGKAVRVGPNGPVPPSARPLPALHTGGRCARWWRDRIASGRRPHRSVRRRQPPARCAHGGLETRAATGNGRPVAGRRRPPPPAPDREVSDHASGHLRVPSKILRPPLAAVRSICCDTFDRDH